MNVYEMTKELEGENPSRNIIIRVMGQDEDSFNDYLIDTLEEDGENIILVQGEFLDSSIVDDEDDDEDENDDSPDEEGENEDLEE